MGPNRKREAILHSRQNDTGKSVSIVEAAPGVSRTTSMLRGTNSSKESL